MRYRNEKTAPEFRHARSALEEARMTLRDTLASTTDEAKTRELVQRLQESKQKVGRASPKQTSHVLIVHWDAHISLVPLRAWLAVLLHSCTRTSLVRQPRCAAPFIRHATRPA